jgi:predicted CXXCH cytochrome family protein
MLVLAFVVCFAFRAEPAFAWFEGSATIPPSEISPDCRPCHPNSYYVDRTGPHGPFSTATDKCVICHSVHDAASGNKLLPAATMTAACLYCHDGTGGQGVYGAIARRGLTVRAAHRIDTTSTVPGGSGLTGGDAQATFGGVGNTLSCGDCHSPHDSNTVQAYSSERIRFHTNEVLQLPVWPSTKLLKKRPTGATVDVDVYGSDWCASCHRGRRSGESIHNHPVDSLATNSTPFTWDRVALVETLSSITTTFGSMGIIRGADFVAGGMTMPSGWHNRGYVMPYPRTPEQQGHAPICQQCHQNTRAVGEVGAVTAAQIYRYGDGRIKGDPTTDTPRFQNFPHETENPYMLVETDDDLCLNCHPATLLP